MNAEQPLLMIDSLHVYYGGIHALKGISLEAVSYTHLDVYKRQGLLCCSRELLQRCL